MAGPAADHQPTASDVEPYKEMLESAAYDRMRKEHTAEYAPASVFFTHDKHSVIDRRNSFRVKAALVHEAITGHHVDDPTLRSNRLLLALANACHSAIHGSSSSQQKDPAAGNGGIKTEEISKEKKVEEGGGNNEIKKTEEVSQEKKVEEDGAGGLEKSEEVKKEKKVEEGGGIKKTEEVSQEKKVEEDGAGGLEKSEEVKKEKKVEEGGAGGPKKSEEVKKEKKVEEEGGIKKTEEISKLKTVAEAGGEKPGNGSPKASAEESHKAEELTDENWDAERKRVVDGIFLVVGFLPKLMDAIAKSDDRKGADDSFNSRHMHDIVTDVIKIENQLPLQALLAVADAVKSHGVTDAVLASAEFKDVKASIDDKHKLAPVTKESFADVVHKFCWYYSPFFSTKKPKPLPPAPATDDKKQAAASCTLLDCLHQSVLPQRPASGEPVKGRPTRMPAARELKRSGIRVQASETGRAEIKFAEQSVTLWLPALVYDFKLATVARNLLAREYEEQSKPVTRYFQMMNEIVADVVDVRILRKAGVVRAAEAPVYVEAQEVYALIKNIVGQATYPSVYMAMDREIELVKKHSEIRMKNFFVRNRPRVVWASSVAAISVVAIVAARKIRG